MKLYYSNGACSLAVRIVLEELELPYEQEKIDIRKDPPPEYLKLHPLGEVPVLVTDAGDVITEVAVILTYLADLRPERGMIPRPGTLERVRVREALNFIATELHKGFGPLFSVEAMATDPKAREEIKAFAHGALAARCQILDTRINGRETLLPLGYTVADAYLFTILRWARYMGPDLAQWPSLRKYVDQMVTRPAVRKALQTEHLI